MQKPKKPSTEGKYEPAVIDTENLECGFSIFIQK